MAFASMRRFLTLGLCTVLPPAFAQVAVNKGFNPISASAGQVSTLTVQFLNAGAGDATGASLTDTLPAGLVVATPLNVDTTCTPGSASATAGGGSVSLTNGTIPAATVGGPGSCTLTVDVVAAAAGSYINTIPAGAVTSSQGSNPQPTQATLTVTALAPVAATKAFSPANVHGNGVSTLTITLPNANTVDLTGVAFTDTLPVQLVIATPSNLATTCSPGTPTGASGGGTVGLSGGTIPAGGSCTVSVDVTPAAPDNFFNNTVTNTVAAGNLTSDQGVSNSAFSGPVLVQTGAQLIKAFATSPVADGASSTFTIAVRNFNATPLAPPTTPVTFTDNMPAGITPTAVATTCSGATTSFTATSVSVSGGTLAASPAGAGATTCTVTVTYTATNAGTTPVTATNTIPAGNFGGVNYNTATATVTINPANTVVGTKAFTGAAVQTGTLTLTITLDNSSATAANITSFTDDLATMGTGYTVAASPAASTTCGGTVNATPGTTPITMTSGAIPAAGSCTITVPVAIAGNAQTGNRTNTIAINGVQTDLGNNLAPITATVNVRAALALTKSFSPGAVGAGQTSVLTLTITRTANAAPLTSLGLTDTLPATPFAATIAATPAPTTTCGGTLSAVAGTNVVSLTGGNLAGGAAATSCTITVGVATPNGASGTATNTIAVASITTTEGASNPAAASATLTASNTPVSLSKGFSPLTVSLGGTTTLSLQILNNNPGALTLTNVGLTDNLPAGMIIATPPNATFTGSGCSGATLTANSGTGVFQLSGATIVANAICGLSVSVEATAAGNLINTIPASAVTSDQGLTNTGAVSATVTSSGSADLSITKSDGVTQAVPGTSVTYQIVASNSGPDDVDGATVTDTPPSGVTFTAWTCAQGTGATCPAPSGSGPISGLVSLASGASVTYQVTAAIAPGATGSISNTATITPPGTVVDTNPANNSATDTDVLVPTVDVSVVKTGPAAVMVGQPISYTVLVQNAGPSDADGTTFSDPVPAAVTGVTATCGSETGGAVCGPVSGGNNVASTITTFPVGGSVTFTISGTAPTATGTVVNTATVQPAAGITDSNPANNSSTASTTITAAPPPQADVAVAKTGPATIVAGQDIVYSISVTNNGPDQADGVSLADPAPQGLTFVSAGAPCSAGFPCSLGSMSLGQTITISGVTFSTASSLSGAVVNTASVSSTTLDPNLTNNTASVRTTVRATASVPRVPVDSRWLLLLLTALLGAAGSWVVHRR